MAKAQYSCGQAVMEADSTIAAHVTAIQIAFSH